MTAVADLLSHRDEEVPMLTQVRDDLWETRGESPFPGLTTHAYLWTAGPSGNVLFYSTVSDRDFDQIGRLGGVAHHYLSHRDEAGPMVGSIAARFGAQLHAGRGDADRIERVGKDVAWIDERVREDTGVEVVPTPGHTPGSICFLVEAGSGEQYLFTGDTLYVERDGSWKAGNLGFSDPVTLGESLELLASLHPTLVISSAAPSGTGVHDIYGDWPTAVRNAQAQLGR